MVVVEKHHEALLVPDEERGSAVAQAFRRLGRARHARVPWRAPRRPPAAGTGSRHYFEAGRAIARWIRRRRRRSLLRAEHCSRSIRHRLRNLLLMELFDSLLDDEILVRQSGDPGGGGARAATASCGMRTRGLLATLVVPGRSAHRRSLDKSRPVRSIPVSVVTGGGAGGLLALARHNPAGIEIASVEPTLRDLDDLAGSAARVVSAAESSGQRLQSSSSCRTRQAGRRRSN